MRLTVLGSGAACPPGGQNSSGYLVETGRDDAGGRRLLLDCGHGVASALLAVRPQADIDDIWVTHMHADHFIDVLALRFRVSRLLTGVPEAERRITLHLPPGGRAKLEVILAAVSFPADFLDRAFRVREYAPDDVYEAGGVRVRVAAGRTTSRATRSASRPTAPRSATRATRRPAPASWRWRAGRTCSSAKPPSTSPRTATCAATARPRRRRGWPPRRARDGCC